jgi:hypothetical protein
LRRARWFFTLAISLKRKICDGDCEQPQSAVIARENIEIAQ